MDLEGGGFDGELGLEKCVQKHMEGVSIGA